MRLNHWNNRLPQQRFEERLLKRFSSKLILKIKSNVQNSKWFENAGRDFRKKLVVSKKT